MQSGMRLKMCESFIVGLCSLLSGGKFDEFESHPDIINGESRKTRQLGDAVNCLDNLH